MSTITPGNEPADPPAKGILPSLKQNLKDLVIWKQRVIVVNDYGEETCEWQQPEKLRNPFSLFAQLSARDVRIQNSHWPSSLQMNECRWTWPFDTMILILHSVALLPLRFLRLDGRCIRFPRSVHSNHEICKVLQDRQHQHLVGHHPDSASPLRRCCVLRSPWRQIRTQVAHGCQHDHSGSSSDRNHLFYYIPTIPRCAKLVRSIYGWCIRKCHRNGSRALPCQC
jgi:hypothetical protein